MALSPEQRVAGRRQFTTSIMLLTKDDYAGYKKEKSYYTPAKMCNLSDEGMYFESDYALQPGSDIYIKVVSRQDQDLRQVSDNNYKAKVKWCKEIADSFPSSFGVGVQLFMT